MIEPRLEESWSNANTILNYCFILLLWFFFLKGHMEGGTLVWEYLVLLTCSYLLVVPGTLCLQREPAFSVTHVSHEAWAGEHHCCAGSHLRWCQYLPGHRGLTLREFLGQSLLFSSLRGHTCFFPDGFLVSERLMYTWKLSFSFSFQI